MDSKSRLDEKSKKASGSHSHSPHSKQSDKKGGREENYSRKGSDRNQGGKNSDHTGSKGRSYKSYKQKYKNRRKSDTRNRDSSRHSDWDRNKYCNRNDRWNSSRPRYSNLSWQRSDLDHRSDRYQDSQSRSVDRAYSREQKFVDYPQNTLDERLLYDRVNPPNEDRFNKPLPTNKEHSPRFNQRHENHPVVDKPLERRNPFKTFSTEEREIPDQNIFEPCQEGFEIREIEEPSNENVGIPWQTVEYQESPDLYHFGDQTLHRPDEIIPKKEIVGFENQLEDYVEPLTDLAENFVKLETTDSDFDIRNCLNVDINNSFPSISVVPISRLIKSELQDLNRTEIIAPVNPAQKKSTLRPNLVKRKKKTSLSENLVQRVANMDKVGIKNVINNSGTKYDAALKIQARKKLREEIRKQLKSMNFNPAENSENCVVIPDEIVDSMNIPAVLLDEIRKAFGIVLVEDVNVISEQDEPSEKSAINELKPQLELESKTQGPSKSPDLMSRLKMLEEVKSQSEKSPPAKTEPSPKTHSKIKKNNNDVVVINSSSSDSSSSSSDSDSDTSSTSSGSSTTSSFKRRRRKKRILEANVVGNFEKLILPNLSDTQRRRYKHKYSKTTKSSLQYIYGICVTRANLNTTAIDPKEKLKLKRNLTSADNAQALEFLVKAILNLFEQQKEQRRKGKENPPSTQSKSRGKCSNPVSATKNSQDSTSNQRNSDNEQEKEQIATADSAENPELSKHQSTKVDDAPPQPAMGGVNRNEGNSISESANSARGVSYAAADDERLVAHNSESDSELENVTSNGNCPPSRLWKSPGEKKCVKMETPPCLGSLGLMQPPMGIHSLDLDSLRSQSTIGDEAVNSIREIDVKLMELHKRKMYIEEMILKLQKDKMEVDLWTMKLQNEKFILLNSALATASSSSATPASACKSEKKQKPSVKRKLASSSEKVRNQKKLCQNNVLLKDADNEVSKTSNLTRKTRQTKRTARSTTVKSESEKSSTIETAAETKTEEVIAEKDTELVPEKPVEVPHVDYTEVPNGSLEGWKLPITQIIVVGESIIAASEDGNIYKFNIRTRALESKFSKHTEAITQIFICPRENFVYTTSLDGFLKKTSIENFGLEIQSLNIQEPLQSIDIEWGTAFIGSRWGNIFTFDIKSNSLSESLLCSSGSSIIAIKATKEGPRKILIVSSKGNQINFRDAMTGLLLRSLDVPNNLHIYSILLDNGCVFCGTQRNEIYQYNFTTGGRLAIFNCGNGAVSMKLYKDKYIFVGCYDGFVYVLDKTTGCQIGRFPGSGKMILALDIAGDKLITSAKDNTMQIIDIPKYIVTKEKS